MKLSELDHPTFLKLIKRQGVPIRIGPYNVNIGSNFKSVADAVYQLYNNFQIVDKNAFIDFDVSVQKPGNIRKWYKPQCYFLFDEQKPFRPLPASQAMPSLEWGMNWMMANYCHTYLIVHAAVLSNGEHTILLPGTPGSGKSTLCATLMLEGWQLYSDELAMINLHSGKVVSIARPISLKNNSIEIISANYSSAELSQRFIDTSKGDIALLKPSDHSSSHTNTTSLPTTIVFPKYNENGKLTCHEVSKADAFLELIKNCFNYSTIGKKAFEAIGNTLSNCRVYSLEYNSSEASLKGIEQITTTS